ncbi:MAG: TIGR04219 family outer membrane beta-barrel protein [Cellvibrio sp.]
MNMFRKSALAAVALSAASFAPLASADLIFGVYAGAGAWNAELDGSIGKPSISTDDLGTDKETNTFFYVAVEHPVPLVPNVKLQYVDIASSQSGTASTDFSIDGTQFTQSSSVDSDIDLSFVDATLYYELLDNWLNLDIGVTLRKFDGYLAATSDTVSARVKVDEVVPLGYAKAQFDLPFTGWSAAVEANYVSYSDSKISDMSAKIGYTFDSLVLDAGIEAGIRTLDITIDDDGTDADVKLSGPYIAAMFHF